MYGLYINPPINLPACRPLKLVTGPCIIACTKDTRIHTLPEDCPRFCLFRELLQIQPLEGTLKWTSNLERYHTCVYVFVCVCVCVHVRHCVYLIRCVWERCEKSSSLEQWVHWRNTRYLVRDVCCLFFMPVATYGIYECEWVDVFLLCSWQYCKYILLSKI